MALSRQEVNLRRLLVRCELMIKNNQKDDQRFPKYIETLTDMLMSLKDVANLDNIRDYSRRIDTLKRVIFGESYTNSEDNYDISSGKNLSNRTQLLGSENTLRQRSGKSDDLDEILEYHQNMQEKIADDMISLTKNLKEQSQLANKIIKQDTEVVSKSSNLTEQNFSKLKVESEKLAEHSRRACKCWMWIMLVIVMVLFINMVLFMKVMKKKI